MLCEAKKQADKFLRSGDFASAVNMFMTIYGVVCDFRARAPFEDSWPRTDPLSGPTSKALEQLASDCVLCYGSERFVEFPEHIAGLQNKQLLYALDHDARQKINLCQELYGSKITQRQSIMEPK